MLGRTLTEWPQPISPQILRSRLAAFKEELCDANFLMHACASCARQKRRSKLFRVSFPPRNATGAPAWLAWEDDEWLQHRDAWFDQVDAALNIDDYLRVFFKTDERLCAAHVEVAKVAGGEDSSSAFTTVAAATSWLQRVQKWADNLR